MPKSIEERLNAHPALKSQILTLLEITESNIRTADEVEERTIEGVRSIGRQVIQDWADHCEQNISKTVQEEGEAETKLALKGKKTLLVSLQ